MNFGLVCRLLGIVAWLIGATMVASLPWSWPVLGGQEQFETQGASGLLAAMLVCGFVGWTLRTLGRDSQGGLFRKEAMAVVGMSWVLATVLGALPFYLAQTARGWADEEQTVPLRMDFADCLFESQSGFSTTGATVLSDIEDPRLVPRSILFWRSSTHFLGGLESSSSLSPYSDMALLEKRSCEPRYRDRAKRGLKSGCKIRPAILR